MKSMKLKYPDGTNKARLQAAMGTDKDKGRNTAVPAGSKLGQDLKKKDEVASRNFKALPEKEKITKLNQASSEQTKKAAIESTGNTKSANKKLESYTDTKGKVQSALKEAEKKKIDRSSAMTYKAKGVKMMKLGKNK